MTRRGTSNKNQQPNSKQRGRLKAFLLERDGDGETAPCAGRCGRRLVVAEITLDRWPVSGHDGGTYRRNNVRAMCGPCNSSDGSLQMHIRLGHKVKVTVTIEEGS